ncbi:MAG TPA: glycoside hydrolase family 31 protein [Candidatus Acidoferrum sp.]|nr:glycoside hydrolase family 31 protein [Candidatus Acidoferrum sp.]
MQRVLHRYVARVTMIFALFLLLSVSAAAQGWQHVGNVQKVERLPDGVELTAGAARVRITAVNDATFRVRVAPNGTFPLDFSWAVIAAPEPPAVTVEDGKAEVRVTAGSGLAVINKSPLLVRFTDLQGNVLLADEPTLPMAWDSERIRIWKHMPADESYYGLGDKAGPMNRRNRSFTMWNTDEFGWQESSDPLYKTIPFFIGLRAGKAYGVFFDNTWRSSFDFGKESPDYFSFGAEGGELNYYFFAGPDPKKIISEYTGLVGRSPLPPLWSLGYQQCRYSYYPEARAREIVATMRSKKIPLDTIYFDIDYQQGYAPFTVNREYFPHFEKMIADFRSVGVHTILITDLHIKNDPGHGYAPYDSGTASDVFVHNADGSVFSGAVWPGQSVFPDFTLTRVRDWWGGLYADFVHMGAAGFWNDMNEPSVFERADKTMPLTVMHRLDDGSKLDHRAIHNVFGMENVRATYDGLRKLQGDERPFVLTRAAYSGAQRYAASWTGDNSSTWNHLQMSTPMLLSMGISGFPMIGDDIGGFAGSPPADLLTRWFEVGAFNPIYRDHTAKDTADQEPWVSGPEHEAIRRHYIELRYKLLPYLYTGIEEASRTGIPFMRPLFLEYPQETKFYGDNRDFLFGRDFFVAPIVTEMTDAENVQLPPGAWYDFWTGEKRWSATALRLHPRLEELPLFVRAGAMVPMQPLVQSTQETPSGPLQLRVYPGDDCRGSLYQDDGHTFAYQRGEFLRVHYTCQLSAGGVSITSAVEKSTFQPWWTAETIAVYGAPSAPKHLTIDSQPISITETHYDATTHSVTFTISGPPHPWTALLTY